MKNVTIEPPLVSKLAKVSTFGGITVPQSTPKRRNFIFLRPDDIVDFQDQGFKIVMMFRLKDSSPRSTAGSNGIPAPVSNDDDAAKSEVQVKSSNVEPDVETAVPVDDEASDTEEDDDDLDQPSNASFVRTPDVTESTPATSHPEVPTIKETPAHHGADGDDNQPFSIAPGDQSEDVSSTLNDEEEPLGDISSPTVKAQKTLIAKLKHSQDDDSKARASSDVVTTLGGVPSDGEDEQEAFTPNGVGNTYRRRGRQRGTLQDLSKRQPTIVSLGVSGKTNELPSWDAVVPSDEEEDDKSKEAVPPTSDEMLTEDFTYEAARRSVPNTTTKHNLLEDQGEDDAVASKKRRKSAPEAMKAAELDETDVDTDISQVSAGPKAAAKAKRGRLPKVARDETQEKADEIAVATKTVTPKSSGQSKASPRPQRASKNPRASATPSSSSSCSTLTEKLPKILISMSAIANDSSLTKWLKTHGIQIITDVPSRRTDFICVVGDAQRLARTPKVLRTLTLGREVVTEEWIKDSRDAGEIVDPGDYVHQKLRDIADLDRRHLFNGRNVYFTNGLAKQFGTEWAKVEALVKEAGASHVDKGSAGKIGNVEDRNNVVLFGCDDSDADVDRLVIEYGRTVYSKDMLKEGIIAGELDLDGDEYKLTADTPTWAKPKKSRR